MTSEGVGFEVPKAKTISPWALLFLDSHFSVVGRTEVAKKLLSKAVNPLQLINSNCDDFENTALHLACSKGFAELSGWLIDNGARANLLNSLGFVPFEMATASVRGTLWKNEPLARFSFALSLVRGSGLALMENEMAKVRLRVVSPQGHVLEDRVIESCLAPAFTESGDVINVVWHDTVMLSASSMQDIVMLRVSSFASCLDFSDKSAFRCTERMEADVLLAGAILLSNQSSRRKKLVRVICWW